MVHIGPIAERLACVAHTRKADIWHAIPKTIELGIIEATKLASYAFFDDTYRNGPLGSGLAFE